MRAKKKILVVDDDRVYLEVMRMKLEQKNYEVITTTSGKVGLEKVERDKPDAVLLDILLPKTDGLEILRKIRLKHKNLPVFIVTGFSDERRFKLARKFNASGFIVKTSSLDEEIAKVITALRMADKYCAEGESDSQDE